MKYLLTGLLAGVTLWANAQQNNNPLLDQAFWQTRPGLADVKAAVEKGANPAQQNNMAMDPVVMAINADVADEAVFYLLDQKGNDPNKPTHDNRTYLFWAASKGNVAVMKYIISKGGKVTLQDSRGLDVLTFAATSGQLNTAVYDLCLQNGANLQTDLNPDGANALLLAIGSDTALALTSYFQSKGLSLKSKDAAGSTAFDYAAKSGNIQLMKTLLSKGVPFSSNAMLMASQSVRRHTNTIEVYQYLESVGVKPASLSATGDNALHNIVRNPGQNNIIRYFIEKGVDVNQPNEDGNTAFMNAAAYGRDTAALSVLLPLVKNINQANKAGATALAQAVRGSNAEVVAYLLSKGADINTTDAKGNNLAFYLFESYTPRQSKEFDPKFNLLQSKGFNFAAPQKDGNTVYHLAVNKNDLGLLKRIQSVGADVNAKNKEGLTPLHKAAMVAKDDRIMQYLLSIGAKKDVKTEYNETAFDLAGENEFLTKQKIAVDFLK